MSLNYLPDLNCFKLHQKILIDNISVEKIFNSKTVNNFENFNKNNNNWYVNYYNKETERGIMYNDEFLEINWGIKENDLIISEKDKIHKPFKWKKI